MIVFLKVATIEEWLVKIRIETRLNICDDKGIWKNAHLEKYTSVKSGHKA